MAGAFVRLVDSRRVVALRRQAPPSDNHSDFFFFFLTDEKLAGAREIARRGMSYGNNVRLRDVNNGRRERI